MPRPDVPALALAAERYAIALGAMAKTPRARAELEAEIERLLFGERDLWGCVETAVITRIEVVEALADRLASFVGAEDRAGSHAAAETRVVVDRFVQELDAVLPSAGVFVDARGRGVVLADVATGAVRSSVRAMEATLDDPLAIAALVSSRLSAIGVTHMLSGSLALTVYAEPRMSRDLDFVVDLGGFQVPRFLAELGGARRNLGSRRVA